MKKYYSVSILFLIIALFVGCKKSIPNKEFRFTDYGITDGVVEYDYLPSRWEVDDINKTPIGKIEDIVLYALDSDECFVQPQKQWYQDMDYSIARRSDVALPDVMDESSKIVLNSIYSDSLVLSDQASAEFRLYSQKDGDSISQSLHSELWSNSKPIGTVWFYFPQIEGLKYRSEVTLFFHQERLYFIINSTVFDIPKDTALFQEISDWVS